MADDKTTNPTGAFISTGDARKLGRAMAWGAIDAIATFMCFCISVGLVIQLFLPTDATDNGKFDRSGLKIITDKSTGVEYFVSNSGGIIERKKQDDNDG